MNGHLDLFRRPRRLNPKKVWRPTYRTVTPPPTLAALAYAEARARAPDQRLGYGVDRRGPWARVGDATAREATPEAAIRSALAKHLAGTP